jgi:hypothetical protein
MELEAGNRILDSQSQTPVDAPLLIGYEPPCLNGKTGHGYPAIETNLQFASMRQIHAAIEHMERGDFECAITPAEAANGTLAEADEFEIRAAGGTEGANDYINWLKHARLILNGPRIEMAIITER